MFGAYKKIIIHEGFLNSMSEDRSVCNNFTSFVNEGENNNADEGSKGSCLEAGLDRGNASGPSHDDDYYDATRRHMWAN